LYTLGEDKHKMRDSTIGALCVTCSELMNLGRQIVPIEELVEELVEVSTVGLEAKWTFDNSWESGITTIF
jgi:hypothetical protein